MDTRHWLILVLACSLVGTATGFGLRWWYGRKIQALNHRLQKSDKARQFSSQQTMRARRQVEALQKDLAAQQEAMAQAQIAKQRTRHLEEALKAAHDATPDPDSMTLRPSPGFADTQLMS
jgi:uncharacterized protein HemX